MLQIQSCTSYPQCSSENLSTLFTETFRYRTSLTHSTIFTPVSSFSKIQAESITNRCYKEHPDSICHLTPVCPASILLCLIILICLVPVHSGLCYVTNFFTNLFVHARAFTLFSQPLILCVWLLPLFGRCRASPSWTKILFYLCSFM